MILISVGLLLYGCGSDSPSTPEPEPADANTYIKSLPSWGEVVDVYPFEDVVDEVLKPEIDWENDAICSTKKCTLKNSPESIVTFDPDSRILYVGSLIQGKTYAQGLGSMLALPIYERAPLTVTVNLLSDDVYRTVENPSYSTISAAIGDLISLAEASGAETPTTFDFFTKDVYSLKQGMMHLGVSYKHLKGSVAAELNASFSTETHTIISYLVQNAFTVSMDPLQRPGDVFSSAFTKELMQEQVTAGNLGPDNLPVYVSSVTYGRIAMVTLTSQSSESEMKAALEASYGGFVDADLEAQYKQLLNSCEIHVTSIGGGDVEIGSLLDEIKEGRMGSFFDTDIALTAVRPISYVLCNLADNTPAYVGDMTSYTIRTCGGIDANRYTNLGEFTDAVQRAGGQVATWLTTDANMRLGRDEFGNFLTLSPADNFGMTHKVTWYGTETGFPFDFFLESLDVPCPDHFALVYQDNESNEGNDWISIGDKDNCSYDDFRVGAVAPAGVDVFAIGFLFADNEGGSSETWAAYGENRRQVKSMEGYTCPDQGFLSFVSTVPLTCVEYDEGNDGDDIFIKDFFIGYRVRE